MTYNEFVKRPNNLRRRVEHKIEDVESLGALCTRATTALGEKTQFSPDNQAEKNLLRYADARRELLDMFDDFEIAKNEVRTFLYRTLSVDQADLMEWRYVDGLSVTEIAERKVMTVQSVRNKISRANRIASRKYESGYKML